MIGSSGDFRSSISERAISDRWISDQPMTRSPDHPIVPMPSTHKKVIVRKVDRDTVNGHVAPSHFVREGKLELLNTSGNVVAIDRTDIKCVFFVREFGDSDSLSRS